ncbi:hypothetical protein ACVIJ6_004420 [Bradyrhizobium sp. USDA 4369]
MMPDDSAQSAAYGCMKSLLVYVLLFVFLCSAWYVAFDDWGLLLGISAFLAIPFGRFFEKVFGHPPKVPSLREPDSDRTDRSGLIGLGEPVPQAKAASGRVAHQSVPDRTSTDRR